MHEYETSERDEVVTDLGPATSVTQGVWDPVLKEYLVMPQARDF
jgi:hypothetical protein